MALLLTIGTKVKYVRGFQFWLTGIFWIFPILFIAGVIIHIYSHNTTLYNTLPA